MKMMISDYIADFLACHGVEHVFSVTGENAVYLNGSLGHHDKLECIYNHHEQACAMAAESYARLTGKIAAVCVSSGAGAVNAMTGVLGGWLDSVPMFIISGQVKKDMTLWSADTVLRQLGDQEYDVIASAAPMTKYAVMVTEPREIRYHMEKAWFMANNGRKGPVWLDIPLDIQSAEINTDELSGFDARNTVKRENPVYNKAVTDIILEKIRNARRPVILAGEGIHFGNAYKEFVECINALKIPVVTAWNAYDLMWDDNPYFAGRSGTTGTRGGNFTVQNSDLLLVLGCRLNARMTGTVPSCFAPDAYRIMVDIDENEMKKPTVRIDLAVHADVKDVMADLTHCDKNEAGDHSAWLFWCRDINSRYPVCPDRYLEHDRPLNTYAFIKKLSETIDEGNVVVCGNSSASVQTFQAFEIKKRQRLYTNSGCAAMGYCLPAAIGAAAARKGGMTICIDGDGSFMLNLQELQTLSYLRLNLKIFILNNYGYRSIAQEQEAILGRPPVGVDEGSGVSFPDFEKIAAAFDISYRKIDSLKDIGHAFFDVFSTGGPVLCEVTVDENQNVEPRLAAKVLPDGRTIMPQMDDMFPFLPVEEYDSIHRKASEI